MRVDEIHFNYGNSDPTSAPTGAMTIRYAAGRVITAPEWRDGRSDPAAYALTAIRSGVTIKARFSGGRPDDTSQIRAVPASGRSLQWGLDYAGGMRRGAAPRSVAFDSNGVSELESFEIKIPPDSTVGVSDLVWNWQENQSGRWVDVATTHHRIYFTADLPHPPWNRAYQILSMPLLWIEAMEVACVWATGATTVEDTTARIAKAINSIPNQCYDPAADGFVSDQNAPFNLTAFLNDLNSSSSFTNECRGVAAALVTFANLMGDQLCPLQMWPMMQGGITTKDVLPLIATAWVEELFGRHEAATVQGIPPDEFSPVYDACLRLDRDASTPILPFRMPLGHIDPNGLEYRFKLIAKGDLDGLIVMPPRTFF